MTRQNTNKQKQGHHDIDILHLEPLLLHPEDDNDEEEEEEDYDHYDADRARPSQGQMRDMHDSHALKLPEFHNNNKPAAARSSLLETVHLYRLLYIVFVLLLTGLAFLLGRSSPKSQSPTIHANVPCPASPFTAPKPDGFEIIGLVFYGRRRFMKILDGYLQQNLVANGGYLDKVHILIHTNDEEDILWVEDLLQFRPDYHRFDFPPNTTTFFDLWAHAVEPNTMYVKIDDDILYIHEEAIPRAVHSLLGHPDALAIAANLINSPVTSWLHWQTTAIHPFLPDATSSEGHVSDWRPSLLPYYPHHVETPWKPSVHPFPPSHRWLPLPNTYRNLEKTPMARVAYDAFGPQLGSWEMAAQEHYSFLTNLERNELERYWSGVAGDGLWNMWYKHYNINFLAIWGSTVAKNPMRVDTHRLDEWYLSEYLPKLLGMPLMIDMRVLLAHFAFGPQLEGLETTDLLARYQAYADKIIFPRRLRV